MIQPKQKPTMRNLTVTLSEDQLALLDDYCRFLGGATDRTYVIAEALRQVIKRDKRFKNGHTAGGTTPPRRPAGV